MPMSSVPPASNVPNGLSSRGSQPPRQSTIANAARTPGPIPNPHLQQPSYSPHHPPANAAPRHPMMNSPADSTARQQAPVPNPGYDSYSSHVSQPQAVTLGQKPIMTSQQIPPSNQNPTNHHQQDAAVVSQSRPYNPRPDYDSANNLNQSLQTSQAMQVSNQVQQPATNQPASYSSRHPGPAYHILPDIPGQPTSSSGQNFNI